MIKKFPLYKQLDAMDCGPTCLRMVAKYYGRSISLDLLRNKSQYGKEGVSMLGLADAAESIGLKSVGAKLTIEQLITDALLPPIIHSRNPVSLTSFKGKYVLLDFGVSWCGPCRRDFPQVKKLYREYNKYGFEIIGISKDTNTTAYLRGIEKDGINLWTNILFNEQIMKSYFVAAIPVKILIDPKGIIIGVWRGGEEKNFISLKDTIEKNIKKQLD